MTKSSIGNKNNITSTSNGDNSINSNIDSSVRVVRDDIDVRDDIVLEEAPSLTTLTTITSNNHFSSAIPKNLYGLILKLFLEKKNEPFTVYKMEELIGEKSNKIQTTILRSRSKFEEVDVRDKKKLWRLSSLAIDEIRVKIADLEAIERENEIKEQEFHRKLKEQENKDIEVKSFLNEYPPKRNNNYLEIDFEDIISHSREMGDLFIEEPLEFLDSLRRNIKGIFNGIDFRIINTPKDIKLNIEDLRASHLDKLINIEGRITSFGEVRPIISEVRFECRSCGTIYNIPQDYRIDLVNKPNKCKCCGSILLKEIGRDNRNASFIQIEDLQENTDNPHSQRIKCVLFDSLTDKDNIKIFTPGNEINLTGILKEVPIYKNSKKTLKLAWILEVINAELIEDDINIDNFNAEDIEKINILSEEIDKNGLDALLPSFVPEVHGYKEIRSSIILQLCNKRNNPKEGIRSKSNILIIGDPGLAKSVMGDFAISIVSGSRKAVGGGSSAVGITASVVREEDSLGGYRVEPGALVLAKDLLFLDELNNLSDEDKPKLQEGMSEQRISINKANLHVQMKVTCGLIAVANPIHGHFKETELIQNQFNIPTPILNRFDTIFVLKDKVIEENDKMVARKMIERHNKSFSPKYNKEFLKKFFTYIKSRPEPNINGVVTDILTEMYTESRKIKNNGVKVNARFLESLTRMAIASAKIRQSKHVEKKDVDVAMKILSKSEYRNNDFEGF